MLFLLSLEVIVCFKIIKYIINVSVLNEFRFKGVILCGSSCTGKTSTLNVLIDSLTEINKEQTANQDNINNVFKQSNASNSHKIKK
jgi:hypothetical protein